MTLTAPATNAELAIELLAAVTRHFREQNISSFMAGGAWLNRVPENTPLNYGVYRHITTSVRFRTKSGAGGSQFGTEFLTTQMAYSAYGRSQLEATEISRRWLERLVYANLLIIGGGFEQQRFVSAVDMEEDVNLYRHEVTHQINWQRTINVNLG